MQAYKLTATDTLKTLNSSETMGLAESEVLNSKLKHGKNELSKPRGKSLLKKIGQALKEPMMIILLVALAITIAVNILRVTRGEAFDILESVGVFVAILLSVGISIFMERKSEKAFDALKKIGGDNLVKIIRGGKVLSIPQSELAVGDIIKLNSGDKIPADCRLIKSDSLQVDESSLTGESLAVKKNADKTFSGAANIPLAERVNMVYGGTFITSGTALAVCVAVGDNSELGAIAKELKTVESEATPLQKKLNKLGKIITLFGAAAAVLVFVVQLFGLFRTQTANFESIQEIFITSIVLIVAAVPEGLPTIVAISLALSVVKMSKQRVLVKKPAACETIGGVSIICSDKTGTLTENKMTVTDFVIGGKEMQPQLLCSQFVHKNICLNSTADITLKAKGQHKFIGNPTECALLVANENSNQISYADMRKNGKIIKTYPFNSEFKRMTSVLDENGNYTILVKGAPEVLLNRCNIDNFSKERTLKSIAAYQAEAKRVIAFAHAIVPKNTNLNDRESLEKNLIFDGFAVISDPIRKDVYAAVATAKVAGVKVCMLTGDHLSTAQAIAKELKITNQNGDGVFSAGQIEALNDDELAKIIHTIKVVARSTPSIKLRVVKALKQAGEIVAVTGDGVNDAPAIKAADAGVAMGIAGTEVTKEAADIVILDDSFNSVVTGIKFGRGIYENFQRFMLFQLTVNLAAVVVSVVCILIGVGAPFTALQLLWINIIMDGPPALTLGLEPIYDGLMLKKPIRRDASIITKAMMVRIIINGLFIALIVILQATTNFLGVDSLREGTVLFTLFIMFQLFNTFNARELGSKSIFKSITRNKIMLAVITITIMLQVVITQFGGRMFGTVPLGALDWLKVVGLGVSIVAFNELYKLGYKVLRKKKRA